MITNRSLNLGTETAFSVLAKANKLAEQGKEIINLGIGQPDFLTPQHIVEAGIKALRDGHHGYTQASGIPKLREAVCSDIFRRHNLNQLAIAKPGMIEKRINDGTAQVFESIENDSKELDSLDDPSADINPNN